MVIRRAAKAPATLLLLLLLLCQSGIVEPRNRYQERRATTEGIKGNGLKVQEMSNLRQMAAGQNQRALHRRRRGNRNAVFVNGRGQNYVLVGGRGGGKGEGGGRGGGARYVIDDDFFYEDDDWYVQTAPRRGRRSRFTGGNGGGGGGGATHSHTHTHRGGGVPHSHGGGDGDGLGDGQGGGGAVILVRPTSRPPYRGTGIGRLDRLSGRDLPRPGRPRGNRFPTGYRPDMIRPQTPTSAPSAQGPTPSPTTPAPGTPALAPGTTTAPMVPGATSAPTAAPTNDILVMSTFDLTYFTGQPTDVDRDLTTAEYEELATLMNEFYTTEFQADPAFASDFISYDTVITTMMYTMGGMPHIFMDFDANFSFANGSTITPNEVLVKMEGLDYESFIRDYLMRNPPLNQLDNVQAVNFMASTAPA